MVTNLILSGIQPTGRLHIGNYFGTVRLWKRLQSQHKTIYAIADLHALTDVRQAKMQVDEMARALLACGIQPENLFIQSQAIVIFVIQEGGATRGISLDF